MKHKKDTNLRQKLSDLLYTLCVTGINFDIGKARQFIKQKIYSKVKSRNK